MFSFDILCLAFSLQINYIPELVKAQLRAGKLENYNNAGIAIFRDMHDHAINSQSCIYF